MVKESRKTQTILNQIKSEISKLPTEAEKQLATHILAYKAILERIDDLDEALQKERNK